MPIPKVFESEYRFCLLLWKNEPIGSGELAKLCEKQLGWKKSTTYTVIKRLAERGVLKNEDSVVSVLIPKEKVLISESNQIVNESFSGSLPKFVAAFLGNNQTLSDEDADALMKLIKDNMKGGK